MPSVPRIVTFSSEAFLPVLDLWIAGLRSLGLGRIRVYALDEATLAWCGDRGVDACPCPWGGGLTDLWLARLEIFRRLLADGEEFIHSDADAIWVRNPLEEGSAAALGDDLVFSQGTYWPPDIHRRQGFVLCCGWFWVRPTDAAGAFFRAVEDDARTSRNDQVSLNRVLAAAGARWSRGEGDYELPVGERLFRCWREPIRATLESSPLTVAMLPHREFQRMPEAYERVIVRHFRIPPGGGDRVQALRDLGAFDRDGQGGG